MENLYYLYLLGIVKFKKNEEFNNVNIYIFIDIFKKILRIRFHNNYNILKKTMINLNNLCYGRFYK